MSLKSKMELMKHVNKCVKVIVCVKQIFYSWNPSACICDNSKCSKIILDDLKIVCDEIKNAADSVSAILTNILRKNVVSSISTNLYEKKVRYKMDCCFLHMILLVFELLLIILLLLLAIILLLS